MTVRTAVILVFVLVSSLPVRAPALLPAAGAAPALQPPPGIPPAAMLPRNLIVKLRPSANVCLSCKLARRERLGTLGVGSRLDELNRRFGVRAARPLIRKHAGHELAAKFPLRTSRAAAGAELPDLSGVYIVEVGHRGALEALARVYAADPAVEYCEPNGTVQVALVPNDPYFRSHGSWGQGFDDLWGVKQIAAPAAWDTTRGAGVVVAVVDTGIDYTHPDIAANVWTNPGEIAGNGIDDDGNGFVDDVYGWDFADGDADPMDDHLHGTHVAGTIAAVGNNATGVIGVAFESRVMPVRALNKRGAGFTSDLAEAIVYAVDNGADVINASWGGWGSSALVSDAIAYAHTAGVVFVAAAGNANSDTARFFPANDPNAITVAASTHLDTKASFSNFGVKLDVAAPGGGDDPPPVVRRIPSYSVLSLFSSAVQLAADSLYRTALVGDRYLRLAGTSMAAPHVAGTAALILSAHPQWSVEQVRQVLRTTADDLDPPGADVNSGFGRVNAARAVTAPAPLVAHLASPMAATVVGETLIPVRGSASGPGFVSYTVDYASALTPGDWVPIVGPITTPADDVLLANWNVGDLLDSTYILRLRAERRGETFVDRVPVTLQSVAIDSPEALAALRPDGPIAIRGTAAGAGFVSYRVEYRRPAQEAPFWEHAPESWQTDGITLAAPPGTPVRRGLLATLDVSGITTGDRFDLRVIVENANGTLQRRRQGIVIDPTLRPGWPQQLRIARDVNYLTVADLDGDGVKEILVGSGDEVVVFEPDGSVRPGWPQSVVSSDPFVLTNASPIVADVTGDTATEVIATNGSDLFVWSADGVLQPGFPLSVDPPFGVVWLTAADLDGNGKDEIICGGWYVWAYSGDGRPVDMWTDVWRGLTDGPIAVGDVFGDGLLEIATFKIQFRFWGPRSLTLRGPDLTGLSGWPQPARGSAFTHPGMADLDGDGQLDLVDLDERRLRRFPWVTATKAGAFTALGTKIRMRQPSFPAPRRGRYGTAYSNGLFAYADLDHDGRAEAYVHGIRLGADNPRPFPNSAGRFLDYRAADAVRRTPPQSHELFYYVPFDDNGSLAIGDVDGDGAQELVAGTAGWDNRWVRHAVVVARPDGTLLSQFPKPIPELFTESGDRPASSRSSIDDFRYATPAIADLDGDGLKEILWVDIWTERLYVWNVAGTPSPELADWPMFRHDPKHTNVLPLRR